MMRKKKKPATLSNALISTTITGLSHDGRGITTTADGKTTFVSGALPTEKVNFRLTKKHSRYNEGEAVEITEPALSRVTPDCAHFGVCGGCSLQHMTMASQIELKQTILLEQLKHFGHVIPETILPPIAANEWGYRRKARLGVRYVVKKEKLHIGFREKSSSLLTDIEACLILDPRIGKRLSELHHVVNDLTQREQIPQIEIAAADNTVALVFRHMTNLPAEDITKLIEFGKKYQFDIYLQPNAPQPIQKIWPNDGIDFLTYALPEYQLEMKFHPLDFTQINAEINPLMIKKALELLDPQPTDKILDLFCGLGNFTLPIARYAEHTVGIEGSEEMVIRAGENAKHNGINNAEFFAANLANIPEVRPAWMKKQYDKILLDPARTGAKEIIDIFPRFSAKRIVYVSCNPATLARDAGELVNKQGWKLKAAGVINMFPHTSHVEAIALFEKK